ncbi:MAG: CHAP domain-containing protein [Oscillospiraceae bacterium]|nr:CHAP domain-containing protein [Oscillospiraceae bacterium]
MPCTAEQVIALAQAEVGYLEKKSNAQLDSKTANAGSKNYTKYNRDYVAWGCGGSRAMQWCGAFVSWLFAQAYGLEEAKRLLCGGLFHYTPTGANRFQKKKQYIRRGEDKPKAGDVVFFYSKEKGRIGHTGVVYKVDNTKVYTIEGNTSGANSLITNGGGVKKKSYKLTSTYIHGYGRPAYGQTPEAYSFKEFVKDVQMACGAAVDGIAGPETFSKTVTLSAKENPCHKAVKPVQKQLDVLGYPQVGKADGIAGPKFTDAVLAFQKDHGCRCDGIITARNQTWRKLLKMK